MYKRRYARLIIFLSLCAVVVMIGAYFYGFQSGNRNDYVALKNGEIVLNAKLYRLDGVNYGTSSKNKYRFTFEVGDRKYTAVTVGKYAVTIEEESGNFAVHYIAGEFGRPVLDGSVEETVTVDGVKYYMAKSYESRYFDNSSAPGIGSSIFLFIVAGALLLLALSNLAIVAFYKSVERKGTLADAVFLEAFTSKFGTNRHMAVRLGFKNESEEWMETVTPYAYDIYKVETLKEMDAFAIRYKGKYAVIVENLSGRRI